MPTIDLCAAPTAPAASPPTHPLDTTPRRIGLNRVELEHAAACAGDAPLPFATSAPTSEDPLAGRLGSSPRDDADAAFRRAYASLRDPAQSLTRRGLLGEAGLDAAVAGAIGLLATPALALDIDVALASSGRPRLRAWHRHSGDAVATLATLDGLTFELAWFPVGMWATELARIAALPAEVELAPSRIPHRLDLPFGLADAAAEALATQRDDLIDVLLARELTETDSGTDSGTAAGTAAGDAGANGRAPILADRNSVTAAEAAALLKALHSEARGRLRALLAPIGDSPPDRAGVVSWTLLADGWHAVRAHHTHSGPRLEVVKVEATDLASLLAPVLAEASR